jgi:hypothetical protein
VSVELSVERLCPLSCRDRVSLTGWALAGACGLSAAATGVAPGWKHGSVAL